MALEAATYINQLVASNPVGATDPKAQGDDHIRMIKSVLLACFPNVGGEVSASHTTMNTVLGSGIEGFDTPSNKVKGSVNATAGSSKKALASDVQLVIDLADDYTWTGNHVFSHATNPFLTLRRNGLDHFLSAVSAGLRFTANIGSNIVFRTDLTSHEIIFGADGSLTKDSKTIPDASTAMTWEAVHLFTPSSGLTAIGIGNGRALRGYDTGGTLQHLISLWTDDTVQVGTGAIALKLLGPTVTTSARGRLQDGDLAVIDVPRRTSGLARGQCTAISAGITINTSDLTAGYTFALYNNSGSAVTITQGSGVTLRLAGSSSTGNRSLAARGLASIWCNSGTEAIISGNVS